MMSEALSSMSLPGGYFSADPPTFESLLSSYSSSSPFDFSSFYGNPAASLLGNQPQPSEFPTSSSPVPLGWPSQALGAPGSLPFQPPQMQAQQIPGLPMQPLNMNPAIGSTTTVAPGGGRSVFIPRYELSARGPVYVGSWTRHTKDAPPGGAAPGVSGPAAAAAAAAAAVGPAGTSAAASGSMHGSVPSLVGSPSPSPSPAPKPAKAASGKDRSGRGGREGPGGAGSKEGSTAPPSAKPNPRPPISRPISPKADGEGSTHHGHSAAELQAMIHTTSSLLMAQLQLTEQNVRLVSLFARLQAHWQGELPQELAEELTSGVDSAEAACSFARHTLIAASPSIRAAAPAAPAPSSPHQHAGTAPSGPSAPSSPPQGPSPANTPPPRSTDNLDVPAASLSPSGGGGLSLADSAARAAGAETEGREETVRGASRR